MSRFRNRPLAISALALALGAGAAQAQKFAIVNMQQAVLSTSDGKKAAQILNDKFAPVKSKIDQLVKDIQTKQDAFAKNRPTLTATAAAAAQREIESMTTALKRQQEDAQQDLEDTENQQLSGIVPKIQQIISQYAAANQITFVIDTSANPNNLIYGDASLNISAAVVAAYEKATGAAASPAAGGGAGTAAPAATAPKPPAAAAPKPSAGTGAPSPPAATPKAAPKK